jgi:hypothetical protein
MNLNTLQILRTVSSPYLTIITVTTHILAAPLQSILFGTAVPVTLHIICDTIQAGPASPRLKVGMAGKTANTDYGLSKHCHHHNAADKFTEGLGPTSRYLPSSTTDSCFADGCDLQQGCSINSLFNVIAVHVNSFVASLPEFKNSVAVAYGLLNSLSLSNNHSTCSLMWHRRPRKCCFA